MGDNITVIDRPTRVIVREGGAASTIALMQAQIDRFNISPTPPLDPEVGDVWIEFTPA
jgi:hypothetical protein